MVHNENAEEEEEEDEDDWLYELLTELAESDDSDDEEVKEEPEKEVDNEVVEEETNGETFFIATIFRGNKVEETKIPVKCEDPGPCLVTCKIDEEVFGDKIHAKKGILINTFPNKEKWMKESMEKAKEGHGKQGDEEESQKDKRADAMRPRPVLPRPHP
ncbi:hypothetical protein PIB30_080120 [Stylosanthes scabra]|uniref:Uncharacterized protein n=1 Tax=Stylosanthes scabra TaxID=79078 RepID=A0ABU6QSM6_9FABA|nr:hypothetical protein [Stylosanthes scabra]